MRLPINAYFRLEQLSVEVRTANKIKSDSRLDCVAFAGGYQPVLDARNSKGMFYVTCTDTRGIVNTTDSRRADRLLSIAGKYNLGSLFLLDETASNGRLVAYSNPNGAKVCGKDKKPNPFAGCGKDLLLFLINKDWNSIEMLVIKGACGFALQYAKFLASGELDEQLQELRDSAGELYEYAPADEGLF